MSNENQNGVPPLPPSPSQQPAASQQPAQQAWGQQSWGQPAQPQQPQPQQAWGQPGQQQGQQAWGQPGQQQGQQQGQQAWGQQQAQQNWQQQSQGGTAPSWEQLRASGNFQIPPEYPAAQFRPDKFSIPAFFFSWIWYMVKGMWQKGLVFFVASLVAWWLPFGSLVSLGIAIYAGMYGVRDYLRYYNSKAQFWW